MTFFSLAALMAGVTLLLTVGFIVLIGLTYQKVGVGEALIVSKMQAAPQIVVGPGGAAVLPVFHRAERMSLTAQRVEVSRRGGEGCLTGDDLRLDVSARFDVRVHPTHEDILRVAQAIGAGRASDPQAIRELFEAKFTEALKAVCKQFGALEVFARQLELRDHLIDVIGRDLNGYALDDVTLELGLTPLEAYDANTILDARGLKRASELIDEARVPEAQRPTTDALIAAIGAPRPGGPMPLTREALAWLPEPSSGAGGREAPAVLPGGQAARLALRGASVSVEGADGRALAVVALDRPFQAQLSRDPEDPLRASCALRQRGDGWQTTLTFSAHLAAAREGALDGLPRQRAEAVALDAADLEALLARVRFFMRAQGDERWGQG